MTDTITLPRATVQQTLMALEYASTGNRRPEVISPAISALRTALKQQPANVRYNQKELNEFEQMKDGTWEADRNG